MFCCCRFPLLGQHSSVAPLCLPGREKCDRSVWAEKVGLQIRRDTSRSLKRLPESAGKCPHNRLRLKAALTRWTVNTQRQIPQRTPAVLPLQLALRTGTPGLDRSESPRLEAPFPWPRDLRPGSTSVWQPKRLSSAVPSLGSGAKTLPLDTDAVPSRLLVVVVEDSGSTPQRRRPAKHFSRQSEA